MFVLPKAESMLTGLAMMLKDLLPKIVFVSKHLPNEDGIGVGSGAQGVVPRAEC